MLCSEVEPYGERNKYCANPVCLELVMIEDKDNTIAFGRNNRNAAFVWNLKMARDRS